MDLFFHCTMGFSFAPRRYYISLLLNMSAIFPWEEHEFSLLFFHLTQNPLLHIVWVTGGLNCCFSVLQILKPKVTILLNAFCTCRVVKHKRKNSQWEKHSWAVLLCVTFTNGNSRFLSRKPAKFLFLSTSHSFTSSNIVYKLLIILSLSLSHAHFSFEKFVNKCNVEKNYEMKFGVSVKPPASSFALFTGVLWVFIISVLWLSEKKNVSFWIGEELRGCLGKTEQNSCRELLNLGIWDLGNYL